MSQGIENNTSSQGPNKQKKYVYTEVDHLMNRCASTNVEFHLVVNVILMVGFYVLASFCCGILLLDLVVFPFGLPM